MRFHSDVGNGENCGVTVFVFGRFSPCFHALLLASREDKCCNNSLHDLRYTGGGSDDRLVRFQGAHQPKDRGRDIADLCRNCDLGALKVPISVIAEKAGALGVGADA